MAEFRELIALQQNNLLPTTRNTGNELSRRSLERIEAVEAEVLPSIDDNGGKMLDELKKHTKMLNAILDVIKSESIEITREDIRENQKLAERQSEVLETIEENTRPKKVAVDSKKDFRLGGIGTLLAVALGAVVGAVQGYVKTLKFFGSGLAKAVNWVLDFFPSVKKAITSIREVFVSGVNLVKGGFTKGLELVRGLFDGFVSKGLKIFDSVLDFFKGIFGGEGGMSKIASIFTKVKAAVTAFFEPIFVAFKSIQEGSRPVANLVDGVKGLIGKAISIFEGAINSVKGFFELVGGKLSSFSKVFGGVAKIVGKLAFPLTVIMTLWDTFKGAIEGFEKDGIVGAISGAIKGLINSLIMGPLDMLKDGVSWILDAFGFDKASKLLDSFSFEDLFNQFIDAIFSPIETLGKLMEGLGKAMDTYIVKPMKEAFEPIVDFFISLKDSVLGMLQSISIPEISFTIPIVDKKVSIGPFYPFGKAEATKQAPASEKVAKPTSTGAEATKQVSTNGELVKKNSESESGSVVDASKINPIETSVETPKVKPAPKRKMMVEATSTDDPSFLKGLEVLHENAEKQRIKEQQDDEEWYRKFKEGMDAKAGKWMVTAPEQSTANNVYEQSAQNAGSVQNQSNRGDGNVIVAPTTNVSNNTSNTVVRIPSRNNDLTINEYYSSRYAF